MISRTCAGSGAQTFNGPRAAFYDSRGKSQNDLVANVGALLEEGKVVSGKKGRSVADGPFAESKELVGGFYLIEVASRQEAIDWALRCPLGMDTAEDHETAILGADMPENDRRQRDR